MKIQNSTMPSIAQLSEQYFNQNKNTEKAAESGASFRDVLERTGQAAEVKEDVKFSKHAVNRLSDRKIELTGNQLKRLNEGTRKADAKGINESLVLVDNLAFIVNIKNNTVVTAMEQTDSGEQIYTNIDGAVIA
ncbi:flagellar protein [bacterium C-53]|nr:flagellar protein [Lachnospiraceae bacterium]NBI02116.1 flagellar protein [Lachnospiraceae bacterium]RKJ10376.1 flagellar protein [bacterium C-53]